MCYTQKKIRSLVDHDYWWEDEKINTLLSLLSDTFNPKYPESLIHPQVVVADLLPLISTPDDYKKLFNLNDNIFIVVYLPNK